MKEGREAGRSLMKRVNNTGPKTDPCRTPDGLETTFVILINHASMPIRKEKLSPTGKARRVAN